MSEGKEEKHEAVVTANQKVWSYKWRDVELRLTYDSIRDFLVSGKAKVSEQEIVMFLAHCQHQKLNPFLRECYLIKYSDSEPAAIVSDYHVYLSRAEEHPNYRGFESGVIIESKDGQKDIEGTVFNKDKGRLMGGWCKVYRSDRDVPVTVRINLAGSIKRKKDGSATKFWAEDKQAEMIEKVAISRAHHKAFPRKYQGMITAEEAGMTQNILPGKLIDIEAATDKTMADLKEKATAKEETPEPEPEPEPELGPEIAARQPFPIEGISWDEFEAFLCAQAAVGRIEEVDQGMIDSMVSMAEDPKGQAEFMIAFNSWKAIQPKQADLPIEG